MDGAGRGTRIGDIGRKRPQRGSIWGCGKENDLVEIRPVVVVVVVVEKDTIEAGADWWFDGGNQRFGRRSSSGQGRDPTIDRSSSSVGGL
jgi:hypothetical protein